MSINRKLGDLANVLDDGTEGQVLSFNASGKIAASTLSTEGTLGTLTQSFDSNQTSAISLSSAANTVPFVSVFKEVPQLGITSKGQWDVNSNATNYDFYDEKPYSTYASSTLTPSATGDGTFTNSNPIVVGYQMSSTVNLNSTSPSITAQGSGGSWQVVEFDPTGNHVYMVSNTTQSGYAKTVYQYTMSTPHDLSTLNTTPANTLDMSSRVAGTIAHYCPLHITNSGYDLYFGDYQNNIIYQWKMTTAYDLSTASYHGASSAIFVDSMPSLFIQPDGLTGYQVQDGITGSAVLREFTMSTAWDITTASLSGTTSGTLISRTQAVTISPDGTLVIASDAYGSTTSKYFTMSPGYDLSSLSSGTSFTWQGNSSHTTDTRFSSDGALLYGWSGTYIYNYTTGTSTAFSASDVGKKVVGNSGSAIITGTSGTYKSVTAFADTSAISSWQLFGAEGKTDGSGISLTASSSGGFDISGATYTGNTVNISPILNAITGAGAGTDIKGAYIKNDGTMFYFEWYDKYIYQVPLTTAYDISSATSSGGARSNIQLTQVSSIGDIYFKPDGTRIYVTDWNYSSSSVSQYDLSTPWDVTTMSYDGEQTFTNSYLRTPYSVFFSADGTKMYTTQTNWSTGNPWFINRVTLSTAWDVTTASQTPDTNQTYNLTNNVSGTVTIYGNGQISPDGTKIVLVNRSQSNPQQFILLTMSTPYDLSTISVSEQTVAQNTGSIPTSVVTPDGLKVYTIGNTGTDIYEFDIGEAASINYNSYSPALTNSSNGQINSSSWLDINSMTADETKNDGDIFYAVSTDNRTSWSVAKGSDGVRKIARNNSGTWQYNNDDGSASYYDLSSASYASVYFSPTSQTLDPRGVAFNSDGTKLYVASAAVWQYSLSSPYDISNPTYENKTFSFSSQDAAPSGIQFNNDGTKLYMSGASNHKVFQYSLSSAYDVSTASYDSKSLSSSSTLYGFTFNNNGTKIYLARTNATITEHTLSTPYDVSTAGSATVFNLQSGTYAAGIAFNSDGTKLFVVDNDTGYGVYQYNLSTAYDISTASYASISLSVLSENTNPRQIAFSGNGSKLFVAAANDWTIDQYSTTSTTFGTSETWVNGTNNNEHATLQEALTSQAFNRMNKAQLDAIADANHFSQDSADTLDLMIAPYAASGTSPLSDGVTINYDAASKYKQAIHGTEYDVEFVSTSSVNLTSKISANFKARVL